jgi:hypothetical protein
VTIYQINPFLPQLLDSAQKTMYLSIKRRYNGAHGSRDAMPAPPRQPAARRIMNDVADGLLLDVREISITDLEFDTQSALSRALERILESNNECNFNSFNSSIG